MKKTLFYFSSDIINKYKIKGTTTIKELSTKIIVGLKVYSTYLL